MEAIKTMKKILIRILIFSLLFIFVYGYVKQLQLISKLRTELAKVEVSDYYSCEVTSDNDDSIKFYDVTVVSNYRYRLIFQNNDLVYQGDKSNNSMLCFGYRGTEEERKITDYDKSIVSGV